MYEMDTAVRMLSAIASDKRLQVLEWLKEPARYFPPQVDGDLIRDGVCGVSIAEKLGVSQPTTSRHMKILVDAGLVRANRRKGWTFYKRNEKGVAHGRRLVGAALSKR